MFPPLHHSPSLPRRVRASLCASAFFALAASTPAVAQTPPETFFAVHCEPNNASDFNFRHLEDLVADAEDRNIRLSLEFGVTWAQMILQNPIQLGKVRVWQQAGHAVGAHHHGVNHPYWDGYTDLPPALVSRPEPVLGTMRDFKAIIDPLVGPGGLQYGGLQDSEYEWPWGVPWQTDGGRDPSNAVSVRELRVRNKYGVWHVDHAYLADPIMLADLQALHDTTSSPNVFGVVTHVVAYAATPWIFDAWFDFLEAKDPLGVFHKTVPELLGSERTPLEADTQSLSAALGGTVQLDLLTDATLAGETVQFLLSQSGSDPGVDLGGVFDDGVHLGINPDVWTEFSVIAANSARLPGFLGTLDASGAANAAVNTLGPLPAILIGSEITVIAIVHDAWDIAFSSNPVAFSITP